MQTHYAASRAQGALIAKYSQTKGMTFEVYQTIYTICCTPIMDYASEVCGCEQYTKLETVQHKAIKGHLGVVRHAMIVGDNCCYPTLMTADLLRCISLCLG